MTVGPGKYDYLATRARLQAESEGIILIVINGKYGSGFSIQADPLVTSRLPLMLRVMADEIEKDMKNDLG